MTFRLLVAGRFGFNPPKWVQWAPRQSLSGACVLLRSMSLSSPAVEPYQSLTTAAFLSAFCRTGESRNFTPLLLLRCLRPPSHRVRDGSGTSGEEVRSIPSPTPAAPLRQALKQQRGLSRRLEHLQAILNYRQYLGGRASREHDATGGTPAAAGAGGGARRKNKSPTAAQNTQPLGEEAWRGRPQLRPAHSPRPLPRGAPLCARAWPVTAAHAARPQRSTPLPAALGRKPHSSSTASAPSTASSCCGSSVSTSTAASAWLRYSRLHNCSSAKRASSAVRAAGRG